MKTYGTCSVTGRTIRNNPQAVTRLADRIATMKRELGAENADEWTRAVDERKKRLSTT